MKTYQVFFVEVKPTRTGKNPKKLTLQEPGKQHPLKGVTMWENHPLYEDIAAGQTLELEILEEDSGTPNPNVPGKNYINRTVVDPSNPRTQTAIAPAPKPKDGGPHGDRVLEIYNLLNLKVVPKIDWLVKEVTAISGRQERQMGIDPDAIEQAFNKNAQKDDIQEEDSPF